MSFLASPSERHSHTRDTEAALKVHLLTMKKAPVIFHPFLFALFPALSLVADHLGFLTVNSIIVGLSIITVIVTFLGLSLLKAIGVDSQKAAIIVSICLLLFFSYGHTFYLISNLIGFDVRYRHLLILWGIFFLLLVYFSIKKTADLSGYTNFLNVMGASLVVLSSIQIAGYEISTRQVWSPTREFESANAGVIHAEELPDIYYIILDTYASSSTLREHYNFDNGQFIERLQSQGFFVADESFSNYAMTRLSLASSLNMDYMEKLSPHLENDTRGFEVPGEMIENNNVMWFLKSRGYSFIFFGSGMGITQVNRYADQEIKCGDIDETVGRIIQSTLIWPLADKFEIMQGDARYKRLCMFEKIAEMPAMEGPQFIFAHIPAPHMPFVFDAHGEPLRDYDPARIKEYYVNQLIFINKQIEEMVGQILAQSEVEPIIILQADTGPPYGIEPEAKSAPTTDVVRQSMRILNAYHLPDGGATRLYEEISPVNTFRLLFNFYFNTEIQLLDDQSYFSTPSDPYNFFNVTPIVDYH